MPPLLRTRRWGGAAMDLSRARMVSARRQAPRCGVWSAGPGACTVLLQSGVYLRED